MKILSVLIMAAVMLAKASVAATTPQRDMKEEVRIEQDLAKLNPTLVEPFRNARIAIDANDFAKAAELLAPVAAQVPNFDPAVRRYGASLAKTGRRDEGLRWLEKAVTIKRSAANLTSLAYALAVPEKGEVSRGDRELARTLAVEATRLPDGQDFPSLGFAAQLALQVEDQANARALIAILRDKFPDEMGTD